MTLHNILYIDDHTDILDVAKLALEKLGGFHVETCGSGVSALYLVEHFKPDLVLLDVMMPHLDGPATLIALRLRPGLQDLPAVFITAKLADEDFDEFRRLGAIGLIAKPFNPMELADRVTALWRAHEAAQA